MSTFTDIRAALAAKIQSVDETMAVHEYERYTKNTADLKAMYLSGAEGNERLHGWHIRRVSTRQKAESIGVGGYNCAIWHTWRLRGFMALDDADATENLFDEEIESIRDAFRADPTLGGVVVECIAPDQDTTGAQVTSSQPVLFAGVLCHMVELQVITLHLE